MLPYMYIPKAGFVPPAQSHASYEQALYPQATTAEQTHLLLMNVKAEIIEIKTFNSS